APAGGLADPFQGVPGGNPWPAGNSFDPRNPTFVTPATLEATATDYRDPRIYEWNLDIERQVGTTWLFEVAYVGNSANHLNKTIQANPAMFIPGVDAAGNPLSTAGNVNSRRVYNPGIIASVQLLPRSQPAISIRFS